MRSEFWRGGWTGDLITADWRDIENCVASEVDVTRFQVQRRRNQEIAKMPSYFFSQMVHWDKNVTHSVKPFASKESKASTRGEYLLLWARRGVTLCSAQGVDSLQEEDGVAVFFHWWSRRYGSKGACLENVWRIDLSPPCHAQRAIVCTERVIIHNSVKNH